MLPPTAATARNREAHSSGDSDEWEARRARKSPAGGSSRSDSIDIHRSETNIDEFEDGYGSDDYGGGGYESLGEDEAFEDEDGVSDASDTDGRSGDDGNNAASAEVIDLTNLEVLNDMLSQTQEDAAAIHGLDDTESDDDVILLDSPRIKKSKTPPPTQGWDRGAFRRESVARRHDDDDISESDSEHGDAGAVAEFRYAFAELPHFECVKFLQHTGRSVVNFDEMVQDQSTVQRELQKFVKKHEKSAANEAAEKEAKRGGAKRGAKKGAKKAAPKRKQNYRWRKKK